MSARLQFDIIPEADKAVLYTLILAKGPMTKDEIISHIRMVRGEYPETWQRVETVLKRCIEKRNLVTVKTVRRGWYAQKLYTHINYTFGKGD